MKFTKIPAGYRLTVTSWENDADNYNTKVLEGLELETLNLNLAICKLLSKSSWESKDYFGNMYSATEKELERLEAAAEKIFKLYKVDFEIGEATDAFMEYAGELTGYSEFYTRHVDSIKVEFVPHEILIEDVTDQFGV